MKNREWLASKTNEELAAFIDGLNGSQCGMCACASNESDCIDGNCAKGIAAWLYEEREDTWAMIEEGALLCTGQYWNCEGASCDECPAKINGRKPYERYCVDTCAGAQKLDLVRRCRELADKEAGR